MRILVFIFVNLIKNKRSMNKTNFQEANRKYVSIGYEDLKSLTDDSRKVIGNRRIDENHLKSFKSYSEQQIRRMPAITVNSRTGRLIDGQHRVLAIVEMIEEGILPKDFRFDAMLIDIPEEDELTEVMDANNNFKRIKK